MPYIKKEDREYFDGFDHEAKDHPARNSGELNYLLTLVAKSYLEAHDLKYQTCAEIVSAFENAKHEFQRRVQDPYEDKKIAENGDVY